MISVEPALKSSRLKSISLNMSQIEESSTSEKEINIPRIEDLFKDQSKEIHIHESSTLREQLGKMIHRLEMPLFKNMSYKFARTDEFDKIRKEGNCSIANSEEDFEIDKIIEKKLKKSSELREKLYQQKREMTSQQLGEKKNERNSNDMNYFLKPIEKAKKKQLLKGVKHYSYKDGLRKLELTSASGLLFEMHKLSDERERKEYELTGLLKNSYQNRDSILTEK